MAPITKKTYSRKDNELHESCIKEKENVDPFDELFSSPLKQDVEFKPLSFWEEKLQNIASKKKSKAGCGLYELSDSDDNSSPHKRKRKPKSRSGVPKTKKLQLRAPNLNFIDSTKDESNVCLGKPKFFVSSRRLKANSFPHVNIRKRHLKESNIFETSHEEVNINFGAPKKLIENQTKVKTEISPKPCLNETYNLRSEDCEENMRFSKDESTLCAETLGLNVSDCILASKFDQRQLNKIESKENTEILEVSDFLGNTNTEISNLNEDCSLNLTELFKNLSFHLIKLETEEFEESMRDSECLESTLKEIKDSDVGEYTLNSTEFLQRLSFYLLSKELKEKLGVSEYLGKTGSETILSNVSDYTLNSTFDSTHIISKRKSYLNKLEIKEADNSRRVSDFEEEGSINESEVQGLLELLMNGTTILDKIEISNQSLSDDTTDEFSTQEATVIHDSLQVKTKDSPTLGFNDTQVDSKQISLLSTKISDLSITREIAMDSTPEKASNETQKLTQKEPISSEAFRNITVRRRYNDSRSNEIVQPEKRNEKIEILNSEEEAEKDVEYPSTILKDVDWNRISFMPNPVFESTRMFDDIQERCKVDKRKTSCGGTECSDTVVALKPGKKCLRSMFVLKQLRNGNISSDNLESTKIKGRKFESFVQEMLEMQNDISSFSMTLADTTMLSKTVTNPMSKKSNLQSSVLEFSFSGSEDADEYSSLNSTSLSRRGVERSFMNHTVKICEADNSSEKPSAFKSALGLNVTESFLEDTIVKNEECPKISAREFVLSQCGQTDVLPFEKHFNERTLNDCKKIGEGVYGEVFMYNSDTVIKIIPIEGSELVNASPQKTFEEIISEIVIAMKLSNLRNGDRHRTTGFSETKRCWCVRGKYPKYLLQLWNEFDEAGSGSENDSPVMFKSDQLYIILELANGGKSLESFVFTTAAQSLSIFVQTAFSLAAAEKAFNFEHRDLHWGNILVSPTKDKFMTFLLEDVEYKVPTKGVQVSIIDFTLSRMSHEGCDIFNDLSIDPELFISHGDYQFEIYRMMQKEVQNDWSVYKPKTNIYWLHYTIDKMLKMVHYKNKTAQLHKKSTKELRNLESQVLEWKCSADFVQSEPMGDLLNKF